MVLHFCQFYKQSCVDRFLNTLKLLVAYIDGSLFKFSAALLSLGLNSSDFSQLLLALSNCRCFAYIKPSIL